MTIKITADSFWIEKGSPIMQKAIIAVTRRNTATAGTTFEAFPFESALK